MNSVGCWLLLCFDRGELKRSAVDWRIGDDGKRLPWQPKWNSCCCCWSWWCGWWSEPSMFEEMSDGWGLQRKRKKMSVRWTLRMELHQDESVKQSKPVREPVSHFKTKTISQEYCYRTKNRQLWNRIYHRPNQSQTLTAFKATEINALLVLLKPTNVYRYEEIHWKTLPPPKYFPRYAPGGKGK